MRNKINKIANIQKLSFNNNEHNSRARVPLSREDSEGVQGASPLQKR